MSPRRHPGGFSPGSVTKLCPTMTCGRRIQPGMAVCRGCWHELPPELRRAVDESEPGTRMRHPAVAAVEMHAKKAASR